MNRKRNGQGSKRAPVERTRQLWHRDVPGPLWNGSRRVDFRQIEAYCRVVAHEFEPQKIILFGSYAWGSATPASDVDLVVVMPYRGTATDQVVKIRGRAEAPFPLDLLVWRPGLMRRRDSFTQSIVKEGRVMYEGRHA
jgi:uncharacterized protein